jgi:hypothetical protein
MPGTGPQHRSCASRERTWTPPRGVRHADATGARARRSARDAHRDGARPTWNRWPTAPTACLRVVDRASGAPIAGAAVRRVQGSIEIAFTDEQGPGAGAAAAGRAAGGDR